jgi:hypothetical protein
MKQLIWNVNRDGKTNLTSDQIMTRKEIPRKRRRSITESRGRKKLLCRRPTHKSRKVNHPRRISSSQEQQKNQRNCFKFFLLLKTNELIIAKRKLKRRWRWWKVSYFYVCFLSLSRGRVKILGRAGNLKIKWKKQMWVAIRQSRSVYRLLMKQL